MAMDKKKKRAVLAIMFGKEAPEVKDEDAEENEGLVVALEDAFQALKDDDQEAFVSAMQDALKM